MSSTAAVFLGGIRRNFGVYDVQLHVVPRNSTLNSSSDSFVKGSEHLKSGLAQTSPKSSAAMRIGPTDSSDAVTADSDRSQPEMHSIIAKSNAPKIATRASAL
jgi:hypothetical protein